MAISLRVLIVTVAGLSSRFGESLGRPCLKCLYHEGDYRDSMLYRLIHMAEFDRYIVVGGYRYGELARAVEDEFAGMRDKILLVENRKYAEYGSGYSLYLGLMEALKPDVSEIVFAEGDLLVDRKAFGEICRASNDILTVNRESILASKAVALYFDTRGKIHYIYDTSHNFLEIKEPFSAIYNSGQIWKFAQPGLLREVAASLGDGSWKGTNLSLVQAYFSECGEAEIKMFDRWVNCNTVEDYRKGISEIKEYESIK